MNPYGFEKPLGMRDTLPGDYCAGQKLKELLGRELAAWGYQFMSTPTLEYYETVGKSSAIFETQLFKLMDGEGRTVVLRPDMTAPIARVAASTLKDEPLPLRLAYAESLYRKQQYEAGRPAEFQDIGAELIGDPTTAADAEVIALMLTLLKKAGVDEPRVVIGHTAFVDAFLQETLPGEREIESFKRFLFEKNDVAALQSFDRWQLDGSARGKLTQFINSRQLGNRETLSLISELLPDDTDTAISQSLNAVLETLKAMNFQEYLDVDLTFLNHMDYYTGIVFEGYGRSGSAVSNGGRYDHLLAEFNRDAPATGFGIRLDRLTDEAAAAEFENFSISCMIYDDSTIISAAEAVQKEREMGNDWVMQHIAGIPDINAFTSQFKEVRWLTEGGVGE